MLYSSPQGWFHFMVSGIEFTTWYPPTSSTKDLYHLKMAMLARQVHCIVAPRAARGRTQAAVRTGQTKGLDDLRVAVNLGLRICKKMSFQWSSRFKSNLVCMFYCMFSSCRLSMFIHVPSPRKYETAENTLISSNICFQTQPEEVISQVSRREFCWLRWRQPWGIEVVTYQVHFWASQDQIHEPLVGLNGFHFWR